MEKREKAVISGEMKAILKNVSRTLYLSLKILPEPVKTSMGMGYLLCRFMDTVADSPAVSAAEKLEILALMRGLHKPEQAAALERKAALLAPAAQTRGERELLLKLGKVLALYGRFGEQDKKLFPGLLDAVASGMEMDVRSFPGGEPAAFKTTQDLERYCSLIGGAPGIFWARLYREAIRRSTRAGDNFPSEKDAEMIGSALQITNVLKDMAADLRIGRCYLPQSDLDQSNLTPADLLQPRNMPRLWEITARWIAWAVDRLDQSEAFLLAIPKTELALRAAVIWPVYWAMDTLEQVAHSNLLDPAARPRIKRSRVYSTIASTPPLLLSNTAFARGYRFRRETLIISINRGRF
ncbi:MAG: squalene/phytoene synthase family protein [Elusimicrobiales bacterium]|nr:squalene/phytoene synthase family protein [Elusimicrobiales bacterium]